MPNFSITINSRFRPFSYQELLAPVLASTQAQQQVEENYANLTTQASLAGSKANEQTDPIAYARYKAYSDELNAMAEDLAKNGLTPESRRSMYNMRARYAKDIVPIETAYERRRALADEQRKMQASANGNLRFDNDFSTMSLDKLIENPDMTYNFLNRDDVVNRTSMLAKQALQSIVDNPEISPAERGLLFTKMRSGATLQQLNEALQRGLQPGETGDAAVDALLQVARTVDTSYQGSSAYDTNWVWNGIAQGLYSGVGTTTYNVMQDPWDISPLQERQMKLQEDQFNWQKTQYEEEKNQPIVKVDAKTGRTTVYDPKTKQSSVYNLDGSVAVGADGSGSNYTTALDHVVEVGVKGNGKDKIVNSSKLEDAPELLKGTKLVDYVNLTDNQKAQVDKQIRGDSADNYTYYTRDASRGFLGAGVVGDRHETVIIVPKKQRRTTGVSSTNEEDENNNDY